MQGMQRKEPLCDKAAYVVPGISKEGRKDILGVWIVEHVSSKFG